VVHTPQFNGKQESVKARHRVKPGRRRPDPQPALPPQR